MGSAVEVIAKNNRPALLPGFKSREMQQIIIIQKKKKKKGEKKKKTNPGGAPAVVGHHLIISAHCPPPMVEGGNGLLHTRPCRLHDLGYLGMHHEHQQQAVLSLSLSRHSSRDLQRNSLRTRSNPPTPLSHLKLLESLTATNAHFHNSMIRDPAVRIGVGLLER